MVAALRPSPADFHAGMVEAVGIGSGSHCVEEGGILGVAHLAASDFERVPDRPEGAHPRVIEVVLVARVADRDETRITSAAGIGFHRSGVLPNRPAPSKENPLREVQQRAPVLGVIGMSAAPEAKAVELLSAVKLEDRRGGGTGGVGARRIGEQVVG